MTFLKTTLLAAASALMLTSGAMAAEKKAPVAKKPQSEASLACSKEADEKKLTGKARKSFRASCLKKAKAAAKPAAAKPAKPATPAKPAAGAAKKS